MRVLILGGTVFLGRHLTETLLQHGHDVTLFNRGRSNPDLFADVEHIHGDRRTDLQRLAHGQWDAVIDTSGYLPADVSASAALLKDRTQTYVFVSSISVYDTTAREITAHTPPLPLPEGTDLAHAGVEQARTPQLYGPLKALCEAAAVAHFGSQRSVIARPGLIVGPHDPSDRFTYWPLRVALGGEILAPDEPGHWTQLIDVRDLAGWIVTMVERGGSGAYNVTGPAHAITIGDVLERARAIASTDAQFTWTDEAFLARHAVGAWVELPLWVPHPDCESAFFRIDVSEALAAGLTVRPLEVTIADTLAWAQTAGKELPLKAGLDPVRERELLRAWHARHAPAA